MFKVLVTGGAGFIGSHTADLLIKKGYEVRVLDSLTPPVHPHKERPAYLTEDVELIVGDVRNRNDMEKALQGVKAVFHLAAYQDYLTDFSKFALVNEGGTALLYEIIVDRCLPVEKVVLGSSQAVYGEGKYQCSEHGVQNPPMRPLKQLEAGNWEVKCPSCGEQMKPLPTDESTVNPHNQYAVSKYAQELYALTLGKRHDIPTVALRYSITQGPRQSIHNAYSGLLRSSVVRLLNNLAPVIYEDGQQLRDYVYVGDVAQANLLALEKGTADFEVLNVGGEKPLTVLEYVGMLLKLCGADMKPEIPGQFRFGDMRHVFSDISRIEAVLGWRPVTSPKEAAQRYVAWAQSQPEIEDSYAGAATTMKRLGVLRVVER
ncbi:MAG: SDR family NAD(P)-dependent oxidoreductase [Dehalococcoidia bacterium]|nr:SDR family NAD(P)-dependent oxidoreductase [Dehalococcoidia bacterium]